VGEDIPGALAEAFLSVVATTITLKTQVHERNGDVTPTTQTPSIS
jgi:hypothetical protein